MENVHVKHLFAILQIAEKLFQVESFGKHSDVFMTTRGNGWKVLPITKCQQTFAALMLIAPRINATPIDIGVNNHVRKMQIVNLVIYAIVGFAVLLLLQKAVQLVNAAIGVMVELV